MDTASDVKVEPSDGNDGTKTEPMETDGVKQEPSNGSDAPDVAARAALAAYAKEVDVEMTPVPASAPPLRPEQQAKLASIYAHLLGASRQFQEEAKSKPSPESIASKLQEQQERASRLKAIQLLGRVYVGSIPFEVQENEIREAFKSFGWIQQCAFSYDTTLNKHKGFCFVEYDAPEAALLALEQMNGYIVQGRNIKVGRPNNAPQVLPYLAPLEARAAVHNRIYVASIHPDLAEADIQSVFEAFGNIEKIALAPGREGTGNHRCYGWIDFAQAKSVDEAVAAMNNFDLGGQFLRVRRAVSDPAEVLFVANTYQPSVTVNAVNNPALAAQQQQALVAAQAALAKAATRPGATITPTAALPGATAADANAGATGDANSISADQRYKMMQDRASSMTVLLLKDMVTVADIDDALEGEIRAECEKYGPVLQVKIHHEPGAPSEALARVFVRYQTAQGAEAGLTALNGRFFAGRTVVASTYSTSMFENGQLDG